MSTHHEHGQGIPDRKGEDEILRYVVSATAGTSGQEYFQTLVRRVSVAFGVRWAFVGELDSTSEHVQMLAFCDGENLSENFEYELAGTPCATVVGKGVCYYPDKAQDFFPEDHSLIEMGIVSYYGVSLFNSERKAIGLLALMHDKPMTETPERLQTHMSLFAARGLQKIHFIKRPFPKNGENCSVIVAPHLAGIVCTNERNKNIPHFFSHDLTT